MMDIQPKAWYKSKTVWVQIITLLIGILSAISAFEYLPPEVGVIITGTIIPFVNVVLRWLTNQPIALRSPKKHERFPTGI